MALETEALAMLQSILDLDDAILEKDFDGITQLFEQGNSYAQAKIDKLAYCRAHGLTVDDLLEENNIATEVMDSFTKDLSAIKQRFVKYLMMSATKINNELISEGLHQVVKLRVQKLANNEKMPSYAHTQGDSGMDVFATEDIIIESNSTIKSGLGIKVVVPLGYELQVRPKSGMSLNAAYQNLFIANSPGTIDANFRNEVEVILRNMGTTPIAIPKGNKFAQLVLAPVIQATIEEIPDVDKYPTERVGGFGSTGEK